ncbi:MAG TPA: hypothetical protein VLJ60_09945 [bacterium]|nr:hypothetical protein [bacterium]
MNIKTYTYIAFAVLFSICSCENTNKNPFQKIEKECLSNSDCEEDQECSEDGKCVDLQNDGILPQNDEDIATYDEETDSYEKDGDSESVDEDSEIDLNKDSDGDGIPDYVEKPNGIPVDTNEDGTPDYLDTDSDGDSIPDSVECPKLTCADTDEDGVPDYRDTDSDDDGISDSVEAGANPENPVDTDDDGIPDYRDLDSDNDGILDIHESDKDADGDKIPNYLDPDSDNDTIPDCIEKYGKTFRDTDKDGYPDCKALHDYSKPPADTDGDGAYDFIDLDSDGDGVADSDEVICPNLVKDGRVWNDVDGDGFSDLAEIAVGSKICDKNHGVTDIEGIEFYFELPYGGEEKDDILIFTPTVKKGDIFFNIDTTGSMDGELYNLKHTLSSMIIPQTREKISDSAFGVSQFRDEDELSMIQINPSTGILTVQQAVNLLVAEYGGDGPEAGYFSLNNLALSGTWRNETIPIAIHITDAVSHERGAGADKVSTINALNSKGIKVITVFSEGGYDASNALIQLNELSTSTGAVVPECAGAGRTTLLYSIDENGSGLDTAVINGIDALIKYAAFDVFSSVDDDGNTGTIDTSCFLKKVEAVQFTPPPGDTCAPSAELAKLNGSTYFNGFTNFVTGTSNPAVTGSTLTFKVYAQNDICVKQTKQAQAFTAVIHIVDAATNAYLDSQNVTIIVPPEIPGLGDS